MKTAKRWALMIVTFGALVGTSSQAADVRTTTATLQLDDETPRHWTIAISPSARSMVGRFEVTAVIRARCGMGGITLTPDGTAPPVTATLPPLADGSTCDATQPGMDAAIDDDDAGTPPVPSERSAVAMVILGTCSGATCTPGFTITPHDVSAALPLQLELEARAVAKELDADGCFGETKGGTFAMDATITLVPDA